MIIFFLISLSFATTRKVSQNGLDIIMKWEGCELTAYWDPWGEVWTIGWGTTSYVSDIIGQEIYEGLTISQETADYWLELSVNANCAPNVNKWMDTYNFNQNQFDALVSFAYNIGSIDELVQWGTASISKISNDILLYCFAGGEYLEGLYNRRCDEKALFDTPAGENNDPEPTPTPDTNGMKYQSHGLGKNWYPNVVAGDGDYAGVYGVTLDGLYVDSVKYKVQIEGGQWLPEVSGRSDYAGLFGEPVIGVAIKGGRKYRVHIKGGDWLPWVTGYDINDDNNGYAGDGKIIDAVQIN